MTILDDRDIRARKRHQCSWCWEMIEHGERCHFQKQADEDGVVNLWTHLECLAHEYAWAKRNPGEPRIDAGPRGKSDEEVLG